MVDRGKGQNTPIEGKMLGEKAKNPTEHIKQLHPIENRRVNSIIKHQILLKMRQNSPRKVYI